MQNDFFRKLGPIALGSRLRYTSDRFTQEAAKIYSLYGLELEPRWFPILYALLLQDNQSVTELAEVIGHSQASVSQIIKEMNRRKFVRISNDPEDRRKTIVTLSPKAHQHLPALQQQVADVKQAVDNLLAQTQHNLWQALNELDYLLEEQSLLERVSQQRKQRERQQVLIVPYTEQYQDAFRCLNEEWITTYFALEEADHIALNNPQSKIIQPGGAILMALYQDEPVGCCALLKVNKTTYELAKMAVSPKAQGKHIGWLLGQAIIEKARELKAQKIYLESNTRLKSAIQLYHKLGFERVKATPSPYQRCNIQMELTL